MKGLHGCEAPFLFHSPPSLCDTSPQQSGGAIASVVNLYFSSPTLM